MKRTLIALLTLTAVLSSQTIEAENVVNINNAASALNEMKVPNTHYIISCTINLRGKRLTMPSDCILEFEEGGRITSGYLTGNNTKIVGKTEGIFNDTNISGSFDVPNISTNMFVNVTYDNALKDVMALASQNVQNTVTIEALPEGKTYKVSTSEGPDIVRVPSNTDVVLHGTVQLAANSEESYSIFYTNLAENVTFSGDGTIIGDRATHTGTKGEWGMGINVVGSKKVHITGLTIRDCWGDCIYVGRSNGVESQDVTIDNCLLTGSRRQGISVVACYNSVMKDLEIRDIRGTDPQSAIDVEPNSGDTCTGVWIQNVKVRNCYFGIISTTPGDAISKITDIHIEDCDVESEVLGLSASNCDLFEVKKTHVLTEYAALRTHISNVKVDNCFFVPYEGKELESDIVVLWDVVLDARNSEFHGNKFIDNPKATPASKRMILMNNKIYGPVELKIQSSQILKNTIYSDHAPLMSVILGEGNSIQSNTLIYTGEDQPANLLDIQTANNTVRNNKFEYQPTGIPSLQSWNVQPSQANVYTMDGRLLLSNILYSTLHLPRGKYIVDGKKMMVR